MQDQVRLTPTAYIVLGLIAAAGEATPYELKQMVAAGIGHFWSLQHAQLYSEPARLAAAGHLKEKREAGGRRRKRYTITPSGRAALRAWVATPTDDFTELRDPGLLRLFFGADPAMLGAAQLAVHRRRLAEYEAMRELAGEDTGTGPELTLDAGIAHEREWVRFWSRLAREV